MKSLKSLSSAVAVAVFFLASSAAHADIMFCGYTPTCKGHNFASTTNYPHVEDIILNWSSDPSTTQYLTVGGTQTSLLTQCAPIAGDPAGPRNEIRVTQDVNVLLRAYIRIDCVNGLPAGARYTVTFYIDGVQTGGATRFIRMKEGSAAPMLPQGDTFAALAQNVTAGLHSVDVKVNVVDTNGSGTMTVALAWLHAVGTPTTYPAGRVNNDPAISITGTWTQITSPITFSNNTGANIDLFTQGNLQFQGGTPGQRLSFGFGIKPHTSNIYPSSAHTSDVEVPCPLKDSSGQCYWPTVDTARDGINISDDIRSIGPGDWDVVLYAINRAGGTTTVGYRELELLAFPSQNSSSPSDQITTSPYYNTTPITVSTTSTDVQPTALDTSCGGIASPWTKIATLSLPPTTGDYLWTIEGYVDFEGRVSGTWNDSTVQLAFEAVTSDTGASQEVGTQTLSLPAGLHGYYIFSDIGTWSNAGGNTINVWAKKQKGTCWTTVCANTADNSDASFNIGSRYFTVKLVPIPPKTTGACYNYNP